MADHIETLQAIRSAFVGIPAPCAELEALDAAIAALTHSQPVTPAGGEVEPDTVVHNADTPGHFAIITPALPARTKLYTHPPVADAALVDLYAAAAKGFHISETCGPEGKYHRISKFKTLADLQAYEDAWRKAMIQVRYAGEGA